MLVDITMRRTGFAAALLLPTIASAQSADRTPPPPVLGVSDGRVAGAFALGTVGALALDRTLAEHLQQPALQRNRVLSRTATAFRLLAQPGVVVALPTVWAVGRLAGDRTTADVGLHASEAVFVAVVGTNVVKMLVGRARPWIDTHDPTNVGLLRGITGGAAYRSFPSGHTTTAFAAAAALTAETMRRRPGARWSVGVPAYTAATLAGLSRMYDNRHWASDVVAGAGIGTLAGVAVVRYHHTRPNSRTDRWFLGVSRNNGGSFVPMVSKGGE